ncbi:polyketide cyclase/dehydrase [Sulfitobacter sp. F26169L]|uniref:polyketide cyclase/dehydrase n=1 Tax=Sulfitobacter sp. F26169L TaxID=2996015 RepID=UPI002260EB9C|nr:polyketide cyclase/dehydrase [Sulfitobacter sp. F26169L]MCX7568171.1 polyketide cyclase/dehydrase [Sulfitobacter sp. F26169L]
MFAKTIRVLAPALALAAGMLGLFAVMLALGVNTVSFGFLIGLPVIAGCVILHFRPAGTFRSFGGALVWLVGISLLSVLGSLVSGLEGLICVAMAIVPIIIGTLVGGVIYLTAQRWLSGRHSSLKIITLPVLALFMLDMLPTQPRTYLISNSIVIDAPVAMVFDMLKTIPDIAANEIPTRASHLLGVPKPTHAIWQEGPDATVRHSHWGEHVHFREHITAIDSNRRIEWTFAFPDGWAAEGIEDPHITVGGRYFNVLSGGYTLDELAGKTRLTLHTRTYDNSNLGAYAKFWHRFFFEDFHEVILILIKSRAEKRQIALSAR